MARLARLLSLSLSLPVLVSFVVSCSGGVADPRSEDALVGGVVATPDDDAPYRSAVMVRGCSAAKVGPRHFLSAAHCLIGNMDTGAPAYGPGDLVDVTVRGSTTTLTAERCVVHESFRRLYGTADWTEMSDVAVLVVREETPSIPAAAVDAKPAAPGDRVVITGYGCESNGEEHVPPRLRIHPTAILAPQVESFVPRLQPSEFHARWIERAAPFVVMTPGRGLDPSGANICPGDSGGPLFREGEALVVGVNATTFLSTAVPLEDGANGHARVDVESRYAIGAWLAWHGVDVR